MSSKVSQKEYLKKYLSGDKKKHKSKKKRRDGSRESSRVRIIDDDVDVRRKDYDDDEADLLTGEDAPQIVGIIDERPAELKTYEDFKTSNKWKSLSSNSHTATESGRRDDQRKSHRQSRERSVEKYRKSTSSRSRRSVSKDLSPARKRRRTPEEISQRDQSPPRRQRRDSSDDRRYRKEGNVFSNVPKRENKMSNPFRGDVVDYRKSWKDERVQKPDWKRESPPRKQYQGRDRRNDTNSKFHPSNKWRSSSSDRKMGQSNFNPFRSTSSSKQNPYPERNRNEYSDYTSNNDTNKSINPFRSKPMPSFVNRPVSPVHKMQATNLKPVRRMPEAQYSKGSSFGTVRFNPFRENQNKNLEGGKPKQFSNERNERTSRWEDNSKQKTPPREKPLPYRKNSSGDFYEKRKPIQYAEKGYGKYDQDNNRHSSKRNFPDHDKYQKGNNFKNGRGFQNEKSAQYSVKVPSQSYSYGKRSYEDAFESKNSNQRQKEEYVDRRRDGKRSRWNNDTTSGRIVK